MEEDYSELAQKCMDFTNQFKHSSHFSFSVNFDTFSFTVTHSKSRKGDEETQGKKKYISPSNRRRDQRHLKAFLEKKAQHWNGITPSSEEDAKLDTSQSSTSGSTKSSGEGAKLDTSQPPSSPNTAQLSPRTANTENIVTYTQEDFNKKTKHTCDTCGIHYDKSKNLKRHNKIHHQDTITLEQVDGNTSLVEESQSSPSETHGIEKEEMEALLEKFQKQSLTILDRTLDRYKHWTDANTG